LEKTKLKFNYEAKSDENREVSQKPSAALLEFDKNIIDIIFLKNFI
jgi:hypothetical protein